MRTLGVLILANETTINLVAGILQEYSSANLDECYRLFGKVELRLDGDKLEVRVCDQSDEEPGDQTQSSLPIPASPPACSVQPQY